MRQLFKVVNTKWSINQCLNCLVFLSFMFVLLSSPASRADENQGKESQDTVKIPPKVEPNDLYDLILSDPRNRHYLDLSKQGWISGLGAKTFLRFGGFVQVNFIRDFQNTGYSFGEFIPAGIPVPTDHTSGVAFDPRATRITFETRTDTEKGLVNTFISMDFSGFAQEGSIQPRLRQAYVSWINAKKRQSVLIGQAATTFNDGDVWPESFDLEGPNSMLYLRQVMVRYSFMMSQSDNWIGSIALEAPQSAIQYGEGLEKLPDIIFTARWKEKWGHLRFGALGRWLAAENNAGSGQAESFGWGLSFSGQALIPYRNDNFQFQLYGGQGTGRYAQDLGSASLGQDAVYDNISVTLNSLGTYGGFIAYQHWWMDVLRTNVAGGLVHVTNQEIQEDDALNRSTYVLVNTLYTPFERFDVGLEYYYGKRVNKSGEAGHANRLMLAVKYSL